MGRPRKTVDELKRSGNYRPSRHEGRVAARESGETPTDPVGSGASKELVAAPSSTTHAHFLIHGRWAEPTLG